LLERMESKSPDGKWIAGAITVQDDRSSHPGVHTTAYLKSVSNSGTQESILVFPNEISKEKGKIELRFNWTASDHLDVLVSELPTFETQVIRYAGIDISVRTASFEIQTPPSPDQIKGALSGADLKSARRLFLDLHCTTKTTEQVTAVRQAWHELGSATSTEVMQDHLIQALMAQCLIEAQPPNSSPDPDIDGAVVLLRSAIQSQDIIEALAGAIGLIQFSDPRDMQSIIDLTHRLPNTATMLREGLSYSCSPNAARTLQLMREQAPNAAIQDQIDANIQRAAPQRQDRCRAKN
jgi:hypothetical protein